MEMTPASDTAATPEATHFRESIAADEAAGIEKLSVDAVNTREKRPLYASRVKVYPKRARGTFRSFKWIVMAATLAVYYLTPWIRWDRGPNAPDQAVLLDFPARRFYFFFIEIWPQEVYYVTGLLILAALVLFLLTSVAGRVWCGYTCPQTVWTDLFLSVERFFEGDRNARMKLDRAGWTAAKIARKSAKHAIWLIIAVATGGAWVFYFADAPTLARQLVAFEAPMVAYVFIGIFTFTTYLLGGIAREQVCTFMCPWPRIQGAMFDEESLLVSYRTDRGEPRGPHKKGEPWEGRGDCIDCNQCVAVCPMGIDIRDGAQLECIQCALCIDACNGIMDKVGRPRGLIAYDTFQNQERRARGEPEQLKIVRPRTLLYASLIVLVASIMLVALVTRSALDINVMRDRNPLFVQLSDGSVRNGYEVKILNKHNEARRFALSVEGLQGARLSVVGIDTENRTAPEFDVEADTMRAFRVLVTAPGNARGAAPIEFRVRDTGDDTIAGAASTFVGPER